MRHDYMNNIASCPVEKKKKIISCNIIIIQKGGAVMTKYIPVITRGYSRKVPVDDIMYLEQRQRKLAIVTGEETYLSYQRIENIEQLLDERFYHTLKKLVVNLDKITAAKDQSIIFQNGEMLMLGRESYVRTKQIYAAYLKNLL